jgi:hypothetical protein
MLSFNPYCWSALYITWTPTFGEFMHIIPHNLLSDEHMWAHPCCLTTPPHSRRTGGPGGAAQRGVWLDLGGVSHSTLWRQGWTLVRFIFIFYFARLPLCNKYFYGIVTFISIHSVILCVVFFGTYLRCTRLYLLNSGTEVVSEEISPVGRNLDRNGQNHYLLTLLWFFLHLSWSCLTFCCYTMIILIFSTLR